MKKIISTVNPRQGAGKTGLVTNIAACLALAEKKTLLVDADPQGNASARLVSSDSYPCSGLYDLLAGRADEVAVVADTGLDFLKIIPAGNDLFGVEQELLLSQDKADLLNSKITAMAGEYEYIFIDSPSSLGPLTVSAIAASEAILIPLPCRADAQVSLEALLPVVADIKKKRRPDLTIAGIALTHCDDRSEVQAIFPEALLSDIATVVLDAAIPASDVSAGHALNEPPAVMRDVMSAASVSYLDLTAELLGR